MTATYAGNLRWWDVAQHRSRAAVASGHGQGIKAMVACPRRPWIFSTGWDRSVRCWDYDKQQEIMTFPGHTGQLFALALTPDGRFLASAGLARDFTAANKTFGEIKIWDLELRREHRSIAAHASMVTSLCCVDDQTLISGCEDGTMKSWDIDTGRQAGATVVNDHPVRALTTLPGHARFVSGGNERMLRFWRLDEKKQLVQEQAVPVPGRDVRGIAISSSQRWLATSGYQTVAIWDLPERRVVHTIKTNSEVYAVAFSPDEKTIAFVNSGRTLQLVNLASGTVRATLAMPSNPAYCVSFLPNVPILMTGGGSFEACELIQWSGKPALPLVIQ